MTALIEFHFHSHFPSAFLGRAEYL